ncbi:MAG: 50S ribosomal protein L30 [Chloroflexi bacterium]|nr:50S ribosomal protein L30 [Anaerolineae bacterium]RLC69664.1 MAG: 50S ribosomal protein L30 [Chloroflexota bacterium]
MSESKVAGGQPEKKLRITYVKSSIGYSTRQKATIRALGLRHLGDVVEQADTPVIRGMVHKVRHLVTVEEVA